MRIRPVNWLWRRLNTHHASSTMRLSTLILAALVIGTLVGALLNSFFAEAIAPLDQYVLSPLAQAFLRLIQFVVVPIVFSSLILGLSRMGAAGQLGRYLAKLLTCYWLTSFVALCLGLSMAWLLKPGVGMHGATLAHAEMVTQTPGLVDWLISLIPVNPLEALSSGNLLQIIMAAALFGIGIGRAQEKARPFIELMESLYSISEHILSAILYVAPIGVFALMCSVIATQGLGVIAGLFLYVMGLLISTVLMMGLYIGILILLQAKPIKFLQALTPALSLAFGTASSNAALPLVLQSLQDEYGLREEIASFAIPLGTALKRDGSAILQGFNALFVAQLYDIPLTSSMLLAIGVSSLLVSFSTPGVPGSALVTMATVLSAAGLPLEGIAVVAGVDRITDSFKTVLNVMGNSTNAILLDRWETNTTTLPLESSSSSNS